MGSAIRATLLNERYRRVVHWNVSEWRKDPDSGKRKRIERPRSEWIPRTNELQRIVSDASFERAQRRMKPVASESLLTGGKAKYLLSGLLKCAKCGAAYVIVDARSYACSSRINGNACENAVRVTRKIAEEKLLTDMRRLFEPESIEQIATDIRLMFNERQRAAAQEAESAPQEVRDLDARITRLRTRLKAGDPDMASDELQAAIDRAEAKRRDSSR